MASWVNCVDYWVHAWNGKAKLYLLAFSRAFLAGNVLGKI